MYKYTEDDGNKVEPMFYATTLPVILINGTSGIGTGASFYVQRSNTITAIYVNRPGVGYTKASINVTGEGQGALLTADLSLGAISSQQANNEILTPAGTIDAIAIISGGYGYGVADISIEGDGTWCTAEAVLDAF